jgi:hypothetical protein
VEQTDLTELHFAWAGGIERGEPHYYRVQNETFVVEYETMRTTRMPAVEWFFSLSRLEGRHPFFQLRRILLILTRPCLHGTQGIITQASIQRNVVGGRLARIC